MPRKKIDCFKCEHFYITWDKRFPYGCRAMGFKTANIPSGDVCRASGEECLWFRHKRKPPGE